MFAWNLPLWGNVAVFVSAAAVIGVAGTKAAGYADRFADRSGWGEAVTGTIFLGFLTALPGLLASVVAALEGQAGLAIHNALGGIAVQTTALAVADIAHRKANLEHAAASATNMMQAAILILLLTLVLLGLSGPNVTVGHIHPTTILLLLAGGSAFWIVYRTQEQPMWLAEQTAETVEDKPEAEHQQQSLRWLLAMLVVSAVTTGLAGAAIGQAGSQLVEQSGLSEAIVGGLFMAVATSLPEVVTSVAAVRRGALTLAVSDVVGGNFFDVMFVAAADLVYLRGSLYHGSDVGSDDFFIGALTVLLNVILLLGLIYRQKHGPGNIGVESALMLVVYLSGMIVLTVAM